MFADMSSCMETQTDAFPLVVALSFSFCAFCIVYPVNHTSQKITVLWYGLNFIFFLKRFSLFAFQHPFQMLSFFLGLFKYLHMLYHNAVPSLHSSQKMVSLLLHYFFGDVLPLCAMYELFLLLVCVRC